MVDCSLLRDTNKLVIFERNRLLLQSKNLDYSIEILYANRAVSKTAKSESQFTLKKLPVTAVYGLIDLEVDRYLIVVTKALVIGQIYHRLIYQVDRVEFIPISMNPSKADKPYLEGLEQLFNQKQFYYSEDYDLTNSLERFIEGNCTMTRRNDNFFYNSAWVEDFARISANEWITGFISGLIVINFCTLGGYTCELVILSRRDKRRQGTRWICRGSNLDGHTANTVETQQMFFADKNGVESVFSFVQTRGSMPFKWQQKPDMKWSPKCYIIGNDKINSELCRKHMDDLKKGYQNVCLVNLVDKKGSQKMLGTQFEKLINSLGDASLRYVWFDFHDECKNLKYENLARLVDQISCELSNYGYFHIERKSNAHPRDYAGKNSQKGIIRSNCMDCLDRTNVVQSVLARNILHDILAKLGIGSKSKSIGAFERLPDKLQEDFRVSWTMNADLISVLYSGTPAMKTDFTLLGKRTVKGTVMDLVYGVKRWFLGNFYDSYTQDMIDVSVGKLKPKREKVRKPLLNIMFVIILLVQIIAAPFLVSHMVDLHLAPQPLLQEVHLGSATHAVDGSVTARPLTRTVQLPGEATSLFWPKLALSIIAMALVVKLLQLMSKAILRKPTLKD